MSMKTKEYVCLFLLSMAMTGCTGEVDNPVSKQRGFELTNFSNTGCKSTMTRGYMDSIQESFELTASIDGGLYVKHVNAIYNCGIKQFDAQASIEGQAITVWEKTIKPEILPPCLCSFDIAYEVGPLEDGVPYTLTVTTKNPEDHSITAEMNKKEWKIDFVYSPTLSEVVNISKE